jgi:hypothetical protein
MKKILTDWLGGEKLAERILSKLETPEANRILKEICDEEGIYRFPELERDLTVGDVKVKGRELVEIREKRYKDSQVQPWG